MPGIDDGHCGSFLSNLRARAAGPLPWGNLARPVRVPGGTFACLLREALNPERTPDGWFVWRDLGSEVAVYAAGTRVGLLTGFVICGLRMKCDQVMETAELTVPLATGTQDEPAGMIMTGEITARGHPLLVDAWGDVAVAGCWTAVVDVARRVAAAAGTDIGGEPLLPGAVWTAAGVVTGGVVTDGEFTVVPQARHAIDVRTGAGPGRG